MQQLQRWQLQSWRCVAEAAGARPHVACLAVPQHQRGNSPGAVPMDSIVELHTQEELQLRNAISAAAAPNHRVCMSFIRLTKAFAQYIRQHAGSASGGQPQPPSFRAAHVAGLRHQMEHVLHVLQQQGNTLIPQDLALLAQGCRRLRLIVEHLPSLAGPRDAVCGELVALCFRSPNMQHTDVLVWGIFLHGLAAAGVRTPEFTKLLAWVVGHLPSEPLSPVPLSSRSRACARLMWAYAEAGYQGDCKPLLQYIMAAVQAGFMQAASASHRSQLLWSMAKLQLPQAQLLALLGEMLPPLAAWGAEHPERVSPAIVSGTCFALATAGVSPSNTHSIDAAAVDGWLGVVKAFVASGGMNTASAQETADMAWAAAQMQIQLTPAAAENGHVVSENGAAGAQGSRVAQGYAAAANGVPEQLRAAAMVNGSGDVAGHQQQQQQHQHYQEQQQHHQPQPVAGTNGVHTITPLLNGTVSDEETGGMKGPDIWHRS